MTEQEKWTKKVESENKILMSCINEILMIISPLPDEDSIENVIGSIIEQSVRKINKIYKTKGKSNVK